MTARTTIRLHRIIAGVAIALTLAGADGTLSPEPAKLAAAAVHLLSN